MNPPFEIQGHRGSRATRPENTLPSFEAAMDACANSIETDIQFSRNGTAVVYHDSWVRNSICSVFLNDHKGTFRKTPLLSRLCTATIQRLIVERNPDSNRFPRQVAERTPLTEWFAHENFAPSFDPYTIPLLNHLFEFVRAYASEPGEIHGKSGLQRANAARLILDLEIKSEPFDAPVSAICLVTLAKFLKQSRMMDRCRVRSFDHRIVKEMKRLLPNVETAVLIAGTAPVDPVRLTRDAGAAIYCPDYRSLDAEQVQTLHAQGIRIIPWTVNDPAEWRKLLAWQIDGITTDDPANLAEFVRRQMPGEIR